MSPDPTEPLAPPTELLAPPSSPTPETEAAAAGGARARQLAGEIHELRDTLHRIAETFTARVDGRLAGIERSLGGRGRGGRYSGPPPDEAVARVAKQLRRLKLKPDRGRAKDLVRLKDLARALAAAVREDGRP